MKGVTLDKSYTRSTAEDERESLAAQFSIRAVEPDPTKILPDGVYTVIQGQLRPVVEVVSPDLHAHALRDARDSANYAKGITGASAP